VITTSACASVAATRTVQEVERAAAPLLVVELRAAALQVCCCHRKTIRLHIHCKASCAMTCSAPVMPLLNCTQAAPATVGLRCFCVCMLPAAAACMGCVSQLQLGGAAWPADGTPPAVHCTAAHPGPLGGSASKQPNSSSVRPCHQQLASIPRQFGSGTTSNCHCLLEACTQGVEVDTGGGKPRYQTSPMSTGLLHSVCHVNELLYRPSGAGLPPTLATCGVRSAAACEVMLCQHSELPFVASPWDRDVTYFQKSCWSSSACAHQDQKVSRF
jgi:hypothetical protein